MMLRSEMIMQELKEHSPGLAQIQPTQVYTVPNHYFEQFPANLLLKIQEKKLVAQFPVPNNPFSAPDGYFHSFPQQILAQIRLQENGMQQSVEDEIAAIAPLLNQISKKPVYSLPTGYFENSPFISKEKDAIKEKTKVISFSKTRKWITYAAAAIMAGVLVTGALWNNSSLTSSGSAFSLNKEIINVSDDAIQNYLNNDVTASSYVNDTAGIDTEGTLFDIQQSLQNISDEELKGYLKSTDENINVPVAAETKQKLGS